MKIQDVVFFVALLALLLLRKPRLLVGTGMLFILASMPLFVTKTALFTAERLTIYASGLFLTRAIVQLFGFGKEQK